MTVREIAEKLPGVVWAKIVGTLRPTIFYPAIYRSYWHYRFHSSVKPGSHINYYTAVPNRGAGIGHQLANWIAGYWFARRFGLQFAHISFSNKKWETFLGFGENEIPVEVLLQKAYKKVRLPLFNENKQAEVELNKKIIQSYSQQQIVFVAEQDQFYHNQFGVMDDLRTKFYAAAARKQEQLVYDQYHFNIALHIRRGDIVVNQTNPNPNLKMRWQNNQYFEAVLKTVLENIQPGKPVAIYLFSQGKREDFSEFEKFSGINFCLEMGAQDSFLHMVYADLLITSKSSFSYKPALLSKGIKICPSDFWHGYPNEDHWILADDGGKFPLELLQICNQE